MPEQHDAHVRAYNARIAQRLRNAVAEEWLMKLCSDAADEIERLERSVTQLGHVQYRLEQELASKTTPLVEALQLVTDHFADVMAGPMVAGAGIVFPDGVEAIPTIANARAALAKAKR